MLLQRPTSLVGSCFFLFSSFSCSNEKQYYSKVTKNAGAIGHLPEFGREFGHLAVQDKSVTIVFC